MPREARGLRNTSKYVFSYKTEAGAPCLLLTYTMPFEKYLTQGDSSGGSNSAFSHPVEFHIPQFIYAAAPTLALGGGAEVLPFNLLGSPASAWFTNNGFSLANESYVLLLISRV